MDTIANMLTSIRNALAVKKATVIIPYSQLKMKIAKVLAKEKFIKEADQKGRKNKKVIEVILSYDKEGSPDISRLARVSKSSQRVYLPFKKIKPLRRGLGLRIVSTPKGIMTDKEARKEKVGGEILCEVW